MAFVNPTLTRKTHVTFTQKIWRRVLTLLRPLKNPRLLLAVVLLATLALFVTSALTYVVFAQSLASPEAIINRKNSGLIFYDRNGQEFYRSDGARDTKIIPLSQIPVSLQHATVAIEDKDFYKHGGFSFQSIIRAVLSDLRLGNATAYGGSTITQQLVKNALLSQQKSYIRKFQELVLSIEIDRRYSKDQILELYLTSTYYGSNAYGVQEAAQTYFGKPLEKLTIAESAMIAGLPQAPSAYSPLDGDRALGERRHVLVLEAMQKQYYISATELQAAEAQKLIYSASSAQSTNAIAPHLVEYLRSQLASTYGEDTINRSGYKIYTTLDRSLQTASQATVTKRVAALKGTGANNGALVAIDPKTGELLSMVGSADYTNDSIQGKYNVATASRQPGSATKPFMYLNAFSEGYSPATILQDQPTDFGGGYRPLDADRRFRGNVTVRRALSNSLNIPAVQMLQKTGVDGFLSNLNVAGDQDITAAAAARCGLAVVLGCAETQLLHLDHAYATLANEGVYHDLVLYTKIIDKNGNQIYPKKSFGIFDQSTSVSQVLDKGATFLITDILADNTARSAVFGYNSPLKLSRPASVKTGTTDDGKDAWTFGYTPQITVGVWVGNTANTPMTIEGATGAAPIWHDVMEAYLKGKPVETYAEPDTVVRLAVCIGTESAATFSGENTYMEYFLKNYLPKTSCNTAPTPTPTPSLTPTPDASASASPIVTDTPTPVATTIPTVLPTPTPTTKPSATPLPRLTLTPTPTPL
jgi:penicillin-binding protein 1C